MKTYELNTNLIPMFTGTYENVWEPQEISDSGIEVYCEYKHEDLMKSIADVYESQSLNILRELDIDFIKSITFTGGYHSPREYNFSTDSLDFVLEVDEVAMLTKLLELKNDKEFDTYLDDNFSDRPGFWSWTPNTWEGIYNAIKNNTDKQLQSIGAFITFLALDKIKTDDFYGSVESMVYEYWQGNGYMDLQYQPMCFDCDTPVDYEHDFNCQNKDCERYTPMEARA